MLQRRILVVFGSHHGQTQKIAQRIASRLEASNASVTLADLRTLPPPTALGDFDLVVVGGAIEFGRHIPPVRQFVRAHRGALNAQPSMFFSVSGSAGGIDEKSRAAARQYVDDLLKESGWRPIATETIAGATAYTKYNPFLRWVIAKLAARQGGPTDTTRDHELTDWAQVERFADRAAATLDTAMTTPRVATTPEAIAAPT